MVKIKIYYNYNYKDETYIDIGISGFEFLMYAILILICGMILGYFAKVY
jgi:hypothetical protein